MTRRRAHAVLAVGLVAGVVLAGAGPAAAHPLGNVSVNHHAGLVIGTDGIQVDYVLDLAELPTVRERQRIDADDDGTIDGPERSAYRDRRCQALARGIELVVDGTTVDVRSTGGSVRFLDGMAGLETLRMECDLRAEVGAADDGTVITFTNTNPDARGWREVTAIGDEVTLDDTTVPATSISDRLLDYPDDIDLLDVTTADLIASPGGAPAPAVGTTPFGERARAATDRFTSLIASDDITVPLVATSLVVAMLFGALHSLAPGHGKSVIAAYLLGQQRDRRLAFLLGGTVAVTHTASVLVFGGVITLTETAAPEEFYPLFGVISGLLFVALGIALLRQVIVRHRTRRTPWETTVRSPQRGAVTVTSGGPPSEVALDHGHVIPAEHHHDHDAQPHHEPVHHHHGGHGHTHSHDHPHDHHGHDHDDGWHEHQHVDLGAVASGELGWRGVVLPGLAGGLVPSPSALLVFLGGLALGRAWFGIGLVLGYGVGIAATLVTAGWVLARAGDRVTGDGALGRYPRLARAAAYLPAATAVLVIAGGLHIAIRAVV